MMKLVRFEVRNYKGIEHAKLLWDDILVLIGDNNCGKSTVLQALALFLSGSAVRDEFLFRNKCVDEAHAIELIGEFNDLSAKEKENKAVQGRMDGEKWILKKRYWSQAGGEDGDEKWKEMLYSFSPTESFKGWPESTASWKGFSADYQPLIAKLPDKGAKPNKDKLDALRVLVMAEKPELVELTAADWVQNPGGGGNWKSNANSILPKHIWVRAVHEVSDSKGPRCRKLLKTEPNRTQFVEAGPDDQGRYQSKTPQSRLGPRLPAKTYLRVNMRLPWEKRASTT